MSEPTGIGEAIGSAFAVAFGLVLLAINYLQIWTRHGTDDELDHFFRATAAAHAFTRVWLAVLLTCIIIVLLVRRPALRRAAICLAGIAAVGLTYNVVLGLGTF